MSQKLSDAVAKIARPVKVSEDKLEVLREVVRLHRDVSQRLAELEQQVKDVRKQKWEIEFKRLPDMFVEAGVDKVGLPEEGNYPAYDAVLSPYYHANISTTDMTPEERQAAYDWLDREGHGDLIKTHLRVEVGRDQREIAKKIEAFLESVGVDYSSDLSVKWNTLTAWLKEQIEKQGKIPPLSLIGATVGNIVKLKERKNK